MRWLVLPKSAFGSAIAWLKPSRVCALSLADDSQTLLAGLAAAGVELIVVGMSAAVARANRAKDRAVLPLLIATLDELEARRR